VLLKPQRDIAPPVWLLLAERPFAGDNAPSPFRMAGYIICDFFLWGCAFCAFF
jgi:hypothetical protein